MASLSTAPLAAALSVGGRGGASTATVPATAEALEPGAVGGAASPDMDSPSQQKPPRAPRLTCRAPLKVTAPLDFLPPSSTSKAGAPPHLPRAVERDAGVGVALRAQQRHGRRPRHQAPRRHHHHLRRVAQPPSRRRQRGGAATATCDVRTPSACAGASSRRKRLCLRHATTRKAASERRRAGARRGAGVRLACSVEVEAVA